MSITLIIVIVTVLFSLKGFNDQGTIRKFIFHPYSVSRNKQYYRFLTHSLIHADMLHLFFNMYTFYLFGGLVERLFINFKGIPGNILFVLLYLSALFASSASSYFRYRDSPSYSALGASGAVSAIVFAGIALYPQMSLYMFFIPVPIPAWLFALLYLGYSAYMSKQNYDNIGHDAHFWGAVFGIVFTAIFFFPVVISAWRNLIGI